jgi:transcriptional regulator with XRE-family HTH domain
MVKTLAQRVVILRKLQGWSQAFAAEKLGLSRAQMFKLEKSGKKHINEAEVARIAEVFGTTREYLLGLNEPLAHLPQYLRDFVNDPKYAKELEKLFLEVRGREIKEEEKHPVLKAGRAASEKENRG